MTHSVQEDLARREPDHHTVHKELVDEHRLYAAGNIGTISHLLDNKVKNIRFCMYHHFRIPCHISHNQDGYHLRRFCNAEEAILPRNSAYHRARSDMEHGGPPDVLPET